MPTSSSITEARLALGQRLRRLREDNGLTAAELARRCGWDRAKCSRIENGRAPASPETIRAWAQACGAESEAEDLIEAARNIEVMYVEWRSMEGRGLRPAQDMVRPLWARTKDFKAYSQNLIPGPLQTEEYTRTVLTAIRERRRLADDVEEAVASRVEKQRMLNDPAKKFAFVLEEAVLYRRVGPPGVMAEQLGHLVKAAVLPNVLIGIIPRNADRSLVPPVEDFWIFDERQVNVELVSAYLTVKQKREVNLYLDDFRRLTELAVHGGPVFNLIADALRF
ncbi:helix-turn-helix domain-containing protein [Streptomyces goshikiensis]|uniref:helix-turn-helix domain-containing protein n=1 Tax=Streptomyces goshikiensis TaxID=1942 RepID=UPI001675F2B2|nr:helix-turn-helix transcriptional regulator [Streptomyces goshikiensis]